MAIEKITEDSGAREQSHLTWKNVKVREEGGEGWPEFSSLLSKIPLTNQSPCRAKESWVLTYQSVGEGFPVASWLTPKQPHWKVFLVWMDHGSMINWIL